MQVAGLRDFVRMGGQLFSSQPGSGSPTVLRMLLGSQLRKLREAKGITREEAGYLIRASESKISRMELGRVSFKERDVVDLLGMYGVDDDGDRAALVALARDANSPGWWHKYSDVLPDWFSVYVGLEEAASLLRVYEVQFVPGLLQTTEYTRAIVKRGQAAAPAEEVERRVRIAGRPAGDARQAGRAAAVGRDRRGGAAAPDRRPGGYARSAGAADRCHRGAWHYRSGRAVRLGRPRGGGRSFHYHALPRGGAAGRRLRRTA